MSKTYLNIVDFRPGMLFFAEGTNWKKEKIWEYNLVTRVVPGEDVQGVFTTVHFAKVCSSRGSSLHEEMYPTGSPTYWPWAELVDADKWRERVA